MTQPKKILIVDDDLFISDLYSLELQKAGFVVITANEGQAGLSKIQAERPDLVLLDIVMPGLDGLTVLETIRRNPAKYAPNLKILLLTNLRDERTVKDGLTLGADGYLIKTSLTPGQVVKEIQKELGMEKAAF